MSGSVSDILTPFCKIKFDIFDNSNKQVDENKILWYGLMATLEAQVAAMYKPTDLPRPPCSCFSPSKRSP
jgi:hypothetical protein